MSWKKKGNVYGIRRLGMRKHKGKTFVPKARARTKTELYDILTKTKVAHTHYYRIYHHKNRGYTLYVGPEKESHGGIRHRPTTKQQMSRALRGYRSPHKFPRRTKQSVYPDINPPRPKMEFREIKRGRHKGSFKLRNGKIYNPTAFRLFRMKNQEKYEFVEKK